MVVNLKVYIILLFSPLLSLSFRDGTYRSRSTCYVKRNTHIGMTDALVVPAKVQVADALIRTLFSFEPFFNFARNSAVTSIKKRGLKIGVDWDAETTRLKSSYDSLLTNYNQLSRSDVKQPEYYLKPFHSYADGNLCWDAAMEVESAAYCVHAHIYTNDYNKLERDGDAKLRGNFHKNMQLMFLERGISPTRILDIGCSTGLSSMKLCDSFPDAEVIGLDLSPYMLAVGKYEISSKAQNEKYLSRLSFYHAAAEQTGFGTGDVDMVTLCLVSHELPAAAAKEIFQEAYRILPYGGSIAIMDMDPNSASFIKLASNPFAFAAFRSTEPWLLEYASLDLQGTLEECGFSNIGIMSNSPRHRTVVGIKK